MNMTCANKNCSAELKYLRGGRLFLMERKPSAPTISLEAAACATESKTGSFQIPAMSASAQSKSPVVLRRYFWLCESCSQIYSIRRWTENGIELVSRRKSVQIARSVLPHEWTLPGLVG
jgi:hypothetical protein